MSRRCELSDHENDSDSSYATIEFAEALANDSHTSDDDVSQCSVSSVDVSMLGESCPIPSTELVMSTWNLLKRVMPLHWTVISNKNGFNCLQYSKGDEPSFQRNVFVTFSGTLRITVHRKEVPEDLMKQFSKDWPKGQQLTVQSSKTFVDNVLRVVLAVRAYEVCAGADYQKYEHLWATDTIGYIDNNPYDEARYVKTFRSPNCSLLVAVQTWICTECKKCIERFRKKYKQEETVNPSTRNDYLTEAQKCDKLSEQRKQIKNMTKLVNYYKRINAELESSGVNIDEQLGQHLAELVRQEKLSPVMHLFFQQQLQFAGLKDSRGMRWHPALIRFALLIKSTSPSALDAVRQSGMICLPGDRTLFDYSHAVPREEGLFVSKLNMVSDKVDKLPQKHQKFHNLLMDEIHICQKLIYRKPDGRLVGYIKLNEAEAELKDLEAAIQSNVPPQPDVATCILTFMLKGVSNNIREVVAAFPSSAMKKEFLYDRVWEVIPACERRGIKILARISDGCSVNRAFISMHPPANPSELHPGLVFDTVNPCVPDRTLFFIADPPHLLKTIRNNFAKSGQRKKCTRLLTKNGQFIVWKTVEKLYLEDKNLTLRRCPKLNSQNIYLNGYTCMKVSYAAHVMSNTVAQDLLSRKWSETSETVKFIQKHGKRTASTRLEPYRSVDDSRFGELADFEKYFLDWEEEVRLNDKIPKNSKGKAILSHQKLEGIYITVNAFTGAVKYLLKETRVDFVNARIFCQDPLEQYFSKQRASMGGKQNPTVEDFIKNDIRISIHRTMSCNKR
ncbi:Transposable element P transposase [Frankliniella fusca]|uniref:Transposable element P transposase n=1 Tax=Frankliniella fusca TaxID=407009 RepID=A0AAE1LF86_9NEOP|nr:Transposable element P transposase [Frankliniella fusca]